MCITSLYQVLSFCRSYFGVPSTHFVTSPGLSTVINIGYVLFSLYPIHHFVTHIRNPSDLYRPFLSDILDLAITFEEVACETPVSVTELYLNRKYSILRAKRLTTRFGPTVVLTIPEAGANPAQIFLPRRYSDVITDTDIEHINSNTVFLHLVYRGVCSTTKAYLLAIDM